jgi:hypothetical protein
LNTIEIAVNVELQQHGRMIRRPAGSLWRDPIELQIAQIEFIDKNINHPDRLFSSIQSSRHSGNNVL